MIKEQALTALGDLGQVVVMDLLVFRRQRRFLALAERLARIEPQLLARHPLEDGAPLAFPVGVSLVLRLRAADRRHQHGGKSEGFKHPSINHDRSPSFVRSLPDRSACDVHQAGSGYDAGRAKETALRRAATA